MTTGESDRQVVRTERRGRSENGDRRKELSTVVNCRHDSYVVVGKDRYRWRKGVN